MSIKFTHALSLLAFNALPSLHIHTRSLFQVEWLGVGGHASVSGYPEHWTI